MISGRRVLCAAKPGLGHTVPTAALALAFQRAGNEVAVVTDFGQRADLYQRLGLSCVDVRPGSPREAVATMLSLLEDLDPEITVCDWRHDLWLAQRTARPRCRISILRCEQFLGYQRRSPFLPDNFGLGVPVPADAPENAYLRFFGHPPVSDRRDLYRTEVIVVPSMPELDPPPPDPARDYPGTEFVYTGPLQVDCFPSPPPGLESWTEEQRRLGRPVALVTAGTVDRGMDVLVALARSMDRARFSCVMAIANEGVRDRLAGWSHPHLTIVDGARLRELAALCDVAIHHCGHGTLQAVVLAGKPSVTLPSFEYDREDNALRLEDLGCSVHLGDALYRRGLNVELLDGAIERVVRDRHIAAATRSLSRAMSAFMAERGPAHLLRVLEEKNLAEARPRRRRRPLSAMRTYPRSRLASLSLLGHAARARLRKAPSGLERAG